MGTSNDTNSSPADKTAAMNFVNETIAAVTHDGLTERIEPDVLSKAFNAVAEQAEQRSEINKGIVENGKEVVNNIIDAAIADETINKATKDAINAAIDASVKNVTKDNK